MKSEYQRILQELGSLSSIDWKSAANNSYWADQPFMRCEFCRVDCTSKVVYEQHISGKKHQRNMQTHLNSIAATLRNFYSTPSQIGGRMNGQMISGASSSMAAAQELETKIQKLQDSGTAADSVTICTICNVACNSEVAFSQHLSGKKHASQKKRATESQSTVDDLETKKRKVVESGATAVDVRICAVCNVVCNSQTVLDSHIAGQKHAAMVKTHVTHVL